jgi:peptidoglycan lytic transglycosylase C
VRLCWHGVVGYDAEEMKKAFQIVSGIAAVLLLSSCTTGNAIRVITSRSPAQAIRSIAENRVESYKYNPVLALSDIRRARAQLNLLLGNVREQSSKKWGSRESRKLPTRTRYVKYTDGYKSRVTVDFDSGGILIEHLDEPGIKDKLRNAVMVALLTPGDPRSVDLFSDKAVDLNGTPYLQGLVADQNGRLIETRSEAEAYAGYLAEHEMRSKSIDVNGVRKRVSYVQFAMVSTHVEQGALKYAPEVHKYAASTGVSRSLIFAVIKTESSFNPFAVSSAPAYGLMQLVPESGGRDAYRKVNGVDLTPSKEYLFDAENNIELGSTYLSMLLNDSVLQDIDNPLSREYCAIAAYNTGPHNVLRAFSSSQTQALRTINSLSPAKVYDTLRRKLPYAETRSYVVKVVSAQKRYATL